MKKIDKLINEFLICDKSSIKAHRILKVIFKIMFRKDNKNLIYKSFKFRIVGNEVYFTFATSLNNIKTTLFIKHLCKKEKEELNV